jgi:leucyl aminopeptidase
MSFTKSNDGTPLYPVSSASYEQWLANLPGNQQKWLKAAGFRAKAGELCSLPDSNGELHGYAFGMAEQGWLYQLAALPAKLAAGDYRLVSDWQPDQRLQASLGWGLACYKFDLYCKPSKQKPSLFLDDDIAVEVERLLAAQLLVRDLINTPTSDREPRLLKMEWGKGDHPLLALCGKGVCFDTGGLNLKPGSGMGLMKKDMGGGAHVLALARLIMQAKLPVRLLVLIPAVENSVSGNAYRPGDVISTRQGLSIEIGNTDAEGRVVLADALTYACEYKPDLVMDFATLTGAARVALGTDLPPIFSNDISIANEITACGEIEEDPLWVMPLYQPYKQLLKSHIADLNNVSKSAYGGCITAALFMEHFVTEGTDWVHVDTFGWNQTARPGRPVGGEALGLRASFSYLKKRYGQA